MTDGGHYENLGLVELFRRKCKTIWCLDASGDQINTFDTIGGALALAASELGVETSIDPKAQMAPIVPKPTDGSPWFVRSPFATDTFKYADGTEGRLIIVKAGVPTNAPWSIRAYQAQHSKFPCDPTLDQLFDGDRFDAYRELGRFSAGEALKAVNPDGTAVPPPPAPGGGAHD